MQNGQKQKQPGQVEIGQEGMKDKREREDKEDVRVNGGSKEEDRKKQ